MGFLTPGQIRSWYQTSLHVSGFEELDSGVRDIWKQAVIHGKRALPPGFLGSFMERLTRKSSGMRGSAPVFPPESALLDKLYLGTGMEHLEGLFILEGSRCDPLFFQGVLAQLIDRIPGFFHPDVNISASDLEKGLNERTEPDPTFGARDLLNLVYQDAIDSFLREPLDLTPADRFEISHPKLFERPAHRTFYRVMMKALNGIMHWTKGVFTLREETPVVVTMFGEPQVLPLGGYDALSNQGDISSLVPSELAYIDDSMEVDLFTYKFLQNQLLFFKREEGAAFRIRRDVLIRLELTPFLEHERHLGMFFALCLILAEKIIETFVKDIVKVRFEFTGYRPSSLKDACEFFRLFLQEKGNAERVGVLIADEKTPKPEVQHRFQCWFLGERPPKDFKYVPLVFPQKDEFEGLAESIQEKTLGDLIIRTLESMVKDAYR